MEHEPCDVEAEQAKRLDANGDGRPDVTSASWASGTCRAFDLNFDGKVDSWLYESSDGELQRREMDYDRDGTIDEIQLFEAGVLSEKQRVTAMPGRIDTWHEYQGEALVKTERDSDADGYIDQWWTYPTAGCPVIRSDLDGDGAPDPDSAIDYCKETGYVPPERNRASAASPDFKRAGGTPEEVESKRIGGQGASGGEGRSDDRPSGPPPAGDAPSLRGPSAPGDAPPEGGEK